MADRGHTLLAYAQSQAEIRARHTRRLRLWGADPLITFGAAAARSAAARSRCGFRAAGVGPRLAFSAAIRSIISASAGPLARARVTPFAFCFSAMSA